MFKYYDVDFESIKTRLKEFLSAQDEFTGYNFDGSVITEIINLIAFGQQYQATNLNFDSNERFINRAQIPENIFKIANTLNYIPKRSSAAYLNVEMSRNETGYDIIIPKFSIFSMGNLKLTNLEDIIIDDDLVHDVRLHEGSLVTELFVSDGSAFQEYELLNRDSIDDSNLFIYVDEADGFGGFITSTTPWINLNTEPFSIGDNGYFLHHFSNMIIKFDNGDRFAIPQDTDQVRIVYLNTSGSSVNGSVATITMDTSVTNDDKLVITSIGETLSNGTDQESLEAIKTRSPLYYSTQGRGITEQDWNIIIKKFPYYGAFHSGIMWGGEKEWVDPQTRNIVESSQYRFLGHIFISAIKSDFAYLTTQEKDDLVEFLEKFKILTMFFMFLDPNIIKISPTVRVKYDATIDLDLTSVEDSINTHLIGNNGYGESYYHSALISFVNDLSDIIYTDISFTTSVKIRNEDHKVVRLNGSIVPSSLSGTVDSNPITDDGAGNIVFMSSNIGTINYSSGFVTLDYTFTDAEMEIDFEYVDKLNINTDRETFVQYQPIVLETI